MNRELLTGFEYQTGVAHAEFLQSSETGEYFLLEVACRVGGAYIANVLEQASGFNYGANGRNSKPRRRKIHTKHRNFAKISPVSPFV